MAGSGCAGEDNEIGHAMTLEAHDLYFEDLEPGQEVRTVGRTITEADLVTFAGLSGDHNPLHTDAVYAEQGPYGRRIAHGLLGLAVASGLVARLGLFERSIIAFRELTFKFRKPVFIGDTIHAIVCVSSTKALQRVGGGLVELEVHVYNQEDAVVHSGTWKVLVRSREMGSRDGS
jgi:acyl dehydratase